MTRVDVRPELLRWALQRSGHGVADLARRYAKLEAWLGGTASPTLKQLESFARATYTPIGYLFLAAPPVEQVPIPDFRTMAGSWLERPSPNLLDTVYVCQQRQDWYRDAVRGLGEAELEFVGSARVTDDVVATAARMRATLGFDLAERQTLSTWTEALRRFIAQADDAGVLVMVSGVVGSNNRRKLDPDEFRGFALADRLAPLVFINGADTKAAQMFTMAHELAHVWLGESGISDSQALRVPDGVTEQWCNRVAAELLVPLELVQREHRVGAQPQQEAQRLARRFKVSTLVILRRMHDAGALTARELSAAYEEELERLLRIPVQSGGDFYLTTGARVSKRFARTLVISTLEGRTTFSESFRLLGLKKMATFNELGNSLGVPL